MCWPRNTGKVEDVNSSVRATLIPNSTTTRMVARYDFQNHAVHPVSSGVSPLLTSCSPSRIAL